MYPTKAKLLSSLALACLPSGTVLLVLWLTKWHVHWLLWMANAIILVLAMGMLLTTLVVFRIYLYIDEDKAAYFSPIAKDSVWLSWEQVREAVLRERKNFISGTDHLLLLYGPGDLVMYNTSNLSPKDEKYALDLVRSKVDLRIQTYSPSI